MNEAGYLSACVEASLVESSVVKADSWLANDDAIAKCETSFFSKASIRLSMRRGRKGTAKICSVACNQSQYGVYVSL